MELLNISTYNSTVIDNEFNINLGDSSSIILDYSYPTKTFNHTIVYYLVDMNFVEKVEKLEIIDNIKFIKYDSDKIITKIINNG